MKVFSLCKYLFIPFPSSDHDQVNITFWMMMMIMMTETIYAEMSPLLSAWLWKDGILGISLFWEGLNGGIACRFCFSVELGDGFSRMESMVNKF